MFLIQTQYFIIIYYCVYTISFMHFFAYINHIYVMHSTELSEVFNFSFILLYSLNILFTDTNWSWLTCESIKTLEIKSLVVFNLSFPNNTVLSCLFFLFFIIDLYFLVPAVIHKLLFLLQNSQYLREQKLMIQMHKLKHSL